MDSVIELIQEKEKTEWEQTRFLAYITAQVNSTKKLNLTDILSFAWDKKEAKQDVDIEAIKKQRDEYLKSQGYEGN